LGEAAGGERRPALRRGGEPMNISGNVTADPLRATVLRDAAEKARYHDHDDLDPRLMLSLRDANQSAKKESGRSHAGYRS
jgi:hypothetical protein